MKNENIQKQAGILGAASLAVVISLLSMPHPLSTPLLVAAYLAAVALPLNVALFLSPDLSAGYTKPPVPLLVRLHVYFYMLAFPSAFLCVAALLWHVCEPVSVVFVLLSLIALGFLFSIRRAKQRGEIP